MKRSKHSLSHTRLTTWNMGELFPIAVEEILPGDSFRHQTSALVRVSPLVAPVMHSVDLMVHSWFVPNRIMWDQWENFITGTDTDLVVPTLTFDSEDADCFRLAQALGVGVQETTNPVTVNALPFRAVNKIWNEFYRDQDLNTPLVERVGSSGDLPADYAVKNISWEKDYFTTARPYPQQGEDTEVVQLSISGTAPVLGLGVPNPWSPNVSPVTVRESDGTTSTYSNSNTAGGNTNLYIEQATTPAGYPNIRVDLGQAVGAGSMDINAWRRALAMQRMREHRNRYGSRYRDYLAFLGVNSSDSRLQRPEYLGGGKQAIAFSEVLSTAETGGQNVGDMAGHGIAAMRTRPYKRFFEEHGYMITFVAARPRSIYINKVPRHFLRRDYQHYWQKELEMMGEQEITNFEIYGDSTTPSDIFGYIPRYDEYRHAQSYVSGEFRELLDYWHMARIFDSQPVLNASFVGCDPTDRIYASAINDQLYGMFAHRISARRLVSHRARS